MKSTIIEYSKKNFKNTSKKVYFIVVAFLLFFTLQSSAQVSINVNIGGSRPAWCHQEEEYDDVDYYYLPEIEAYYDVNSSVFIYFGSRGWIRSRYLPEYCHNYDLNRGYKVVLDYHGNTPYAFYKQHRVKYYRDCHRNYRQEYYYPNRREGRDNEYVTASDHRDYDDDENYKKEKHHDDDEGRGHGNGHGRR
jgi:hypothetical protein